MTALIAAEGTRSLDAYVPRFLLRWQNARPHERIRVVDGSLAFVDISGFTRLTERLARRGRVGAEEMSDILDATFGALLRVARSDGAELVKWGGDAVLLLYEGDDHAARAARSAWRMRRTLRELSRYPTSAGSISLRMSVGIHSDRFHFFLVGDPAVHRELIVSGPAASTTAELEAAAGAGQIVISRQTAAQLPDRLVGAEVGDGLLLRREPALTDRPDPPGAEPCTDSEVATLLPTKIRQHLLAGSGVSEHRPIAVAFVQFSGTDALLLEHGPQVLADALDECVRTVQHATEAHEVTYFESDINRDGGKIMLTAGAPRSAGRDEDRMLRAVRQIVDGAGALPLRVGVNRGHVFAGDFGPEFRRTYSVKGDAINLAARVMGKARPGEVLATQEILARSGTVFELEPVAPFLVKGKAKPVHASRLGAIRGELTAAAADGPFVGREAEVAALADALNRARGAGTGTVADLVGEAGIGKSRLVTEVRARTGELPVVSGRGAAYQSNTAYFPFRALLRSALAGRYRQSADGDAASLLRRLAADAPQLAPWLPLLGIPLDVALPRTTATRELDEQFRKAKLEDVTVEAIRVLLPGPALIVFEDAHLMDDASADLLRRLESEAARRPWVLLITRQDDATGYRPDPEGPAYQGMRLGAIDEDAALRLLAAATDGVPLTRQALRLIAGRAGGNPLFLGSLAVIAGRSGPLPELPETVEEVVTGQIDRLDPADRTLLRYAAVLGNHFAVAELRDLVAGRAQEVDAGALSRLADFIDQDGAGRLRFRHALTRDVAYGGLPFRLRREMHDRVGRTLEARLPDPQVESELLSLHFFHAGAHAKAWRYSRLAGHRAQERYAYVEAAEFFRRAVEAARQDGEVPVDDVAAVLERLGDVLALAGESREAITAYRRARKQHPDAPVTAAGLLFKEASLAQRLGTFSQSLRILRIGLGRLEAVGGAGAATVRAKLATRYGFCRYLQGRPAEAIRWCRTGVEQAARGEDKAALAMAYNALQLAYLSADRTPDRPYGQLALQTYEEIDDLPGQGHSANTLAIDAHRAGRWGEAEQLFGRAAEIFGRIGDITDESNAIYNRADLLIRQRRYAEAEPLLIDVLATARAVDDGELIALALREHGRVCAGIGRPVDARTLLADAGQRLASLGLRHELVVFEGACADAALRVGDPATAAQRAERGVAAAAELGAGDALPWLHRLWAEGLLGLGELEAAAAAVERARIADGGGDGGYERAMLVRTAARLADARGDQPLAASELASAARILRRLGVVL